MAIYTPSKSGDAMGGLAYKRMNRSERQAYAIAKQAEEERETNQDYYKTKRLASKYEETVRKQRIAAGLEA